LAAAKKLSVKDDDIDEIKTWKDIEDLITQTSNNKNETPYPTSFI